MKKLLIPIMVSIMVFVFVGYVWAGMPNPAPIYCSELGYQVETITEDDGGQYSVCVFPDGNTCEVWSFLQGKCGEEYSYCAKHGYYLKVKTDGKNSYSKDYAVCVDSSGNEVGSVTDLMDFKGRLGSPTTGEIPQWTEGPSESQLQGAADLPSFFDWRNYQGGNWMTSVKDQAQCGSCWAQAACGTAEAVYNIHQGNANLDINLSEEYLNSRCAGNADNGCCGGSYGSALNAMINKGVPDEACMPYDSSAYWGRDPNTGAYICDCFPNPPCNAGCLNGGGTGFCSLAFCSDACFDEDRRLVRIQAYHPAGANNRDLMKHNLIAHGPLTVNALFGAPAMYYDGDINRCTCSPNCGTNHCVIITGWDDDFQGTGKGVWIVKNSWGRGDGPFTPPDGYRYIGYGECGIEGAPSWVEAADIHFPAISVPSNVTFADTCKGDSSYETFNVCNTGKADLSISSISSSCNQFEVVTPTDPNPDPDNPNPDFYPVVISPDFCYPFQVKFSPTSTGQQTATLTISSNDMGHPNVRVAANGNVPTSAIQVSPDPLSFGNVPVDSVGGETDYKDLHLKVRNTGGCNLSVTGIASSGGNAGDFTLQTPVPGFPTIISPDAEFDFTIRFDPSASGSRTTTIRVTSNSGGVSGTITSITANGIGVVPSAQVSPNPLSFGNVPVNPVGGEIGYKDLSIKVRNTGNSNLSVTGIASSGGNAGDFTLQIPVPGFPTIISPDAEFDFTIRFDPSAFGSRTTTIRVTSDSGGVPGTITSITANGVGVVPDIRVSGSTDFGDVCAETLAEKTVSICNNGNSNLNVTSVAFDPACPDPTDFTLINNPFPTSVSPDSCMDVVIRFTPTSVGPKSCTLVIESNDPDQPTVTLTVTANTPEPSIDVPESQSFSPEVIQSVGLCESKKPFPISNTGKCNLKINNIAIGGTNGSDYSLSGLPSFPIILEPGHIAGEGNLKSVFAPTALDRDRLGTITVTYESDPITHSTMSMTCAECGEGVNTGARVLVTVKGVPLATVEKIQLQRITANRNKKILDTQDVVQNATLQTVTPAAPCAPFQYHREYGAVSNPIQLLPGSYQVTASAIVNGKRTSKTVGFDVSTCDFNPNIVIDF